MKPARLVLPGIVVAEALCPLCSVVCGCEASEMVLSSQGVERHSPRRVRFLGGQTASGLSLHVLQSFGGHGYLCPAHL